MAVDRDADLSEFAELLARARADGLEAFDRLRFRFVERMLEQAQAREAGRERILERALSRLTSFREDFDAARAEALVAMQRLGDDATSGLHEAFEQGDYRTVIRAGIRRKGQLAQVLKKEHASKLEQKVVRRSTLPPPTGDALAMATHLYGARSGEALTRRAVLELRTALPDPEDTGPYHGTTVAADALASLNEHSKPLMRAWLQRLRNLDALRPPQPVEA